MTKKSQTRAKPARKLVRAHSKRAKTALPAILTVGHSTRPLAEFVELLRAHGVRRLVDVRTIPRSRHNPQFNQNSLPGTLQKEGMSYVHLPALGGLRHAASDSANLGWRNASFRGFADYMQTEAFAGGINELVRLAGESPTAIMCAEAVPWRCHRSLIADALLVRGFPVEHILSPSRRQPHVLTPFAKVRGETITYPAAVHQDKS